MFIPSTVPGNHLTNPSGSSPLSVIDQKMFQQQLLLQRQLLLQGQAYQQQQQPAQQNQQAKFQQQPNQSHGLFLCVCLFKISNVKTNIHVFLLALNRLVSEMLNDKNGSNAAQQTQQHFQQLFQQQALSNINSILQLQQAVNQQKTFQQPSVPLPTNTTITPVARQNMQPMQKQPVNYPRSNAQNKNLTQNVSSSPMQSRKSFPNAPKSTMPQLQAGMVTAPLNISSTSAKSTLPQAMTSAGGSAKGYADILAASLTNSQASMNITPSLTITKTNSPSGSTSYAKSSNVLPNKLASSPSSSQKSFLPEAISMSLGNVVPLSVKASQSPSLTVMPTNKPNISPTNKAIPVTPLKVFLITVVSHFAGLVFFKIFICFYLQSSPQNVLPGLQKLSPTSPRTKQTPRKNTNPIRTTSLSPATQTSSQSAVPHIDAKSAVPHVETINQSVSIVPSSVNTTVSSGNASLAKPPATAAVTSVVPPTPLKSNVPALVAPVTQLTTKPPQLTPPGNLNSANAKPNVVAPKIETSPTLSNAKSLKIDDTKSTVEVKVEKSDKVETVKTESVKIEKTVDTIKAEKPSVAPPKSTPPASASTPATSQNKPAESKSKQNASQSATQSNTNQSEAKAKDTDKVATTVKSSTDQIIKTPMAKLAKASQPATPIPSSADVRAKRNRFKTIPYQSPTPEIELVSKISANEAINAHKKKVKKMEKDDDKLTLFYK